MDGRTLVPVMEDKLFEPGRGILIEAFNNADTSDPDAVDTRYSAVRTDRYVYAETGPEQELYDLSNDPYELQQPPQRRLPGGRRGRPRPPAGEADLLRRQVLRDEAIAEAAAQVPEWRRLRRERDQGEGQRRLRRPRCLSARFYADGRKAGKDGAGPFDTKVGAKRLDGSGKNRISANVTLLDGRDFTVKRSAPDAC